MKKSICLLGCLLFVVLANAQERYQRMYNLYDAWEDIFQLIHYDSSDGSMSVTGITSNVLAAEGDSTIYQGAFFAKVDAQGNITGKKLYRKNYYDMLMGQENRIENGLISQFVLFKDTQRLTRAYIFYIDTSTFDIVSSIELKKVDPNYIAEVLPYNGKWYCMGYTNLLYNGQPLLMVFDSLGNQLVQKVFTGNFGGGFNYVFTEDKRILISGYSRDSYDQPYHEANWYVLVDTLGNIVWEHKDKDSGITYKSIGVAAVKAGHHYYLYGQEYHNQPRYAYISEIDILTGSIKWKKRYYQFKDEDANSSLFRQIIKVKDNTLYVGGRMVTEDETQYAVLFKQDTAGDILWKRLYREDYYDNKLVGFEFVKDGFVLMGSARDSLNPLKQNGWIIKTDTFGCVVPGCQLYNGIPQVIGKELSFMVYPNPSTSELHVNFKQVGNSDTLVELLVVNMEGKVMVKQKTDITNSEIVLKVAHWPNGFYILNFMSEGKIVGFEKVVVQH